jgi:anthranilate synthase/aminodeoxychorismate synthase-like glutamine amidotransferase
LGQPTQVVRNDAVTTSSVHELSPQALVLSPGPCTPDEAGNSLDLVREFHQTVPLLGICLGHQTIAQALGGRIVRADRPMHGRSSPIFHDGQGVFQGVPNPMSGCRYHSLIVDGESLPSSFEVAARTSDGIIMAIRHTSAATIGLQFHPESILTECGYRVLANFLRLAGLPPATAPDFATELTPPPQKTAPLPTAPVTF